ncbi:hypothetical protein, partial [Streptomyces sp. NPDC002265]|uniref:hypothetical protein n=1 Tax=Streptomyces sp. NPDC002265 TaxID=3154415 RepID=UPI003329B991
MSTGLAVSGIGVLMLSLLDADSSFAFIAAGEMVVGVGVGTAFMPAFGSIPGKADFELHVAAQECYEAAA